MNCNTREEWLMIAVEKLRPLFRGCDHEIPKVRVTCGWPSKGALGRKKRTIGECWDKKATEDDVAQIFISPLLDKADTEDGVLSTLVHELVHAVVGCDAKHGKKFSRLAHSVGLVKPWTSTVAGEELVQRLVTLHGEVGDYPHSPIVPTLKERKKQTTRLRKSECETCGYTVRVTSKWVAIGPPHCPCHGEMYVEPEDKGDIDED